MTLSDALIAAMDRRTALRAQLKDEQTDCHRLFHGVAEGRPGLSIDRYGPTLLGQVWGAPLTPEERSEVEDTIGAVVWRHRGTTEEPSPPGWCQEGGLRFVFQAIHSGMDPFLFLDFRPGRRWLRQHVSTLTDAKVLNTFSYTATAGVVAAAAGAARVVNVDHARSWTRIGRANARENKVDMTFLQVDYFASVRQMAGLKVGRKGRKLPQVPREKYNVVVLDPPTLTKGPFGSVDIVGDYPGLFKPAWLSLVPDGVLLATNHSPKVSLDDWLDQCRRCATKAGRPIRDVELIPLDADFPSFDGAPPLKIAAFHG